jgi:hypothetical protein
MKVDGLLRVAVLGMAAALSLMLVCLARPTPRTIALFLGPGLALGAASVAAYLVRVLRDLRARRVL